MAIVAEPWTLTLWAGTNGTRRSKIMARSIITVPVRGTVEFDRNAPIIAPPAPSLISVTPGNAENALVWSASAGAVNYKVFFQTSPGVTTGSANFLAGNVTSTTHSGLSNGTTYYYRVQAIGPGGGESPLSNELQGTPTASAFTNTNSLLLDGSNDYAVMPQSVTGPFSKNSGQPFSISMWIKPAALSGQQCLWDCRESINGAGYSVTLNGSGQIEVLYQGSSSGTLTCTTIPTLSAGNWAHVCVTKSNSPNSGTFLIYLDGALVAVTRTGTTINGGFSMSNNLILGARGADTASQRYFAGHIDEVSFWDDDLTAAEVEEIYNLGSPADLNLHSAAGANLVSWWRCGDASDTSLIMFDQIGNADFSLVNGAAYDADVP